MKKIITIIAVLSLVFCFSGVAAASSSATANANANVSTNVTSNASVGDTSASGGSVGDTSASGGSVGDININIPPGEQKDLTTIHNKGEGYRGFAPQAEISYPGMPSYFGPAVRNGNVRGVKSIIMYKDTFTRADVKDLLKGVDVDENRLVPQVKDKDKKDTDSVKVVLVPPARKDVLRQCAIINAEATKTGASSVNALAAAIDSALDAGADTLLITAEGAGCQLKSNGWGIGLAWTTAVINTAENTGNTGSGGMGITGGTAGYKSLPWVQGIALDLK